ncbi:hypothetical protein NO1_2086 [Candidatus Termititenax aidoneus]|uniref:PorV/PorQ family protein n=1 Tax=Termititenax aidoneus TaxID=2218524 RepID=A0A388TE46_TERA1|nr:hypothetical protein NO1_2086 [Candidatus Termititenax aidoneus]
MRKILIWGLLIALLPAAEYFSESTGAAFLDNGLAARSDALGRAFAAVADDLDAFYYNPAGYGRQEKQRVNSLFAKNRNIENVYYLGYGQKLGRGYGALNIYSSGIDGIPLTTYEYNAEYAHGETVDSGETFTYGAQALVFSYGETLRWGWLTAPTELGPAALYWGVNLKILRQNLYENSATGFGLDAGLLYKNGPLAFGWSVIDLLEPKLVWDTDSKTVDTVLRKQRFGLAYRILPALLASGEVVLQANEILTGLGAEYFLFGDILAARGGVYTGNYTLGLGLHYAGLTLDYAYLMPQETLVESTHKISLGYIF